MSNLILKACCQWEFLKLCSLVYESTFRGKVGSGCGSLSRKGKEESFPSPHPYCLLGVSQALGPGMEKQQGQVSRQQIRVFTGERSAGVSGNISFGKRKKHAANLAYSHLLIYMYMYVYIYIYSITFPTAIQFQVP